jgi:hypothetical protein
MSIAPELWQPLLEKLAKLRAAWPGAAWGWDPRFKCVASSFGKEIAPRVREAMVGVLTAEWTASTILGAPDDVRVLADRHGGIRSEQLFFTGDVVAGMRLFGLWWPWGDGATVSLRVGIANCDRPNEAFPQVRALFNIS